MGIEWSVELVGWILIGLGGLFVLLAFNATRFEESGLPVFVCSTIALVLVVFGVLILTSADRIREVVLPLFGGGG